MPALAKFLAAYVVFQSMVGAIAYLAYSTGYFADTPAQAQLRESKFQGDKRIGYLNRHGGIIGDAAWLSLAFALIWMWCSDRWSMDAFLVVVGICALLGIPLLNAWSNESFAVPSALGREGYLTTEGAIHYLYMTLGMATLVMFVFTPRIEPWQLWSVAALAMLHIAVGILQPIYHSTGAIPLKTWGIFAAGEGLTVGLVLTRLAVLEKWA